MKLSKLERDAIQRKLNKWGIKNSRVKQNGSVVDKKTQEQIGYVKSVIWNLNKHYPGGILNELNFIHYTVGEEK